ncbi:MAG: hypothetical protein NTX86_01175 [Candidatus Dependentiae bacterium]|nr:hypothetical protein [Candidatus Dependentiae bacterium]
MNKFFGIVIVLANLLLPTTLTAIKVLHLSFHHGCVKDFEVVAQELHLDLTSWYILEKPGAEFDGYSKGNAVYNISHERAEKIWIKHKDYFNQFDAIVTSDTAPLARIFLQNGWKNPLIIWICNRFDYYDWESRDSEFPDAEYYNLFNKAATQSNVKVIGYVAYEHFYASTKGVNTGDIIIKPCGSIENNMRYEGVSYIPHEIKKEETLFIPLRMEPHQVQHLQSTCKKLGIATYCGQYNGPHDLKDFKGILHFPYQWSNLALFENMQLGLPHFVPSIKFLKELYRNDAERHLYRFFALDHLELSEWYCPENSEVMIYFDSWEDLQYKVKTTDYQTLKEKIKAFGVLHKQEMLNRWRDTFAWAQAQL